MSIAAILKIPDEVLETPCEKVGRINITNSEIKTIIQSLRDTLEAAKDPQGAGLAAPQIGVLKRICIARKFSTLKENPNTEIFEEYILIDPKIYSFSDQKALEWEGCLSIPNTYGQVLRSKKIKLKYFDINSNEQRLTATGFFSRVIQHEVDHLDGILFTTKITGKVAAQGDNDNNTVIG